MSGSLTALPPAHKLSAELIGIFAPILDDVRVPRADMLFKLAEDQESTVLRPLRLFTFALATDEDDTWVHRIAEVGGLCNLVKLEP